MSRLRFRAATASDLLQVGEWTDGPADLLQWAGTAFSYPLDERQARDHLAETE
ncbi:hypothetical protein [Halomarina litorea]|uniref:hypothetical protein n=1 Tax=Halomarina litorea TaxID=2961595 RepID=UPI0020C48CB7|nr:hypothetical protein [Halomarina sp. BCD28]